MANWLWTVADLCAAMQARPVGELPQGITGLSIDTRSLEEGNAYFSIKGDVHDGHKFVAAAHAAGAGLSVISGDWLDRLEGETGPLLVVDDVLKALERLAVAGRERTAAKVIAITGSVGKTTTKEALRAALAPSGKVHAAVASFNNHWGVPLTLARMPADTDYAVIEIGMNHPGEITPLVKMARPDVVIITNVAAVHLGAFDSVDEIAHAKAEIFDGLKPGGTAILNGDDERLALLEDRAGAAGVDTILRFGTDPAADSRLDKLVLQETCSCMTATVSGEQIIVKSGVPGKHIVQNLLAVLLAVKCVGADLAKAGLALAGLQAVKGRGQRHTLSFPGGPVILIDESYNANPTSMQAALELLGTVQVNSRQRRIAVLGDMLELGETSSQLHAGLADSILNNGIDRVFLAGTEMTALQQRLSGKIEITHAATIDDLIPLIRADLRPGDALMAKSSLGMKFAKLVNELLEAYPPATRITHNA